MFKRIRHPNLLREILEQIEHNVREGSLRKGDKLPTEREWAATLGVSRTTLREAIKSLELLGVVECTQGAGNYIADDLSTSFTLPLSIMFQLERGTIGQIHQFREAIEMAAVLGAAEVATPEQVGELEHICEEMERGNPAQQVAMAALDRRFHKAIALISANPLIITMMNAAEELIQGQIRGARELMLSRADAHSTINCHHRRIVDALRHRNHDEALAAILEHMEYVGTFFSQIADVG